MERLVTSNTPMDWVRKAPLWISSALLLTACGGGGGSGGGGGNNPPSAAFTISGTVSGLAGSGLVLQNNAGPDLAISAAGSFQFPGTAVGGAAYAVTVKTQPASPSQTCVVTNGAGTVAANVTNIAVNCTTNTYAVGGTVSGLAGTGLALSLNGAAALPIAGNGAFAFPAAVASGATYAVTIATPSARPAQTCVINGGAGTVTNATVTSVAITCTTEYPRFAFVTDQNAGTVSTFAIDAVTGRMGFRGYALTETGPVAVTTDRTQEHVFVANQSSDEISVYLLNRTSGALTPIAGSPFAAGDAPQDVVVDPSGRFLLVPNLLSNDISVFAINATSAALTPVSGMPLALGPDANPNDIVIDRSGRFVFATDSGSNAVHVLELRTSGELVPVMGSPFGNGVSLPIDVELSRDGRFAYVVNAGSNNISVFAIDAQTGALSAVPGSPFATGGQPSAVVAEPSGRYVYVTNYQSNDLYTYQVNATTGALTEITAGHVTTDASPSALRIDPSGEMLLVSAAQASTLSTYRISRTSGLPALVGRSAARRGVSAIAMTQGVERLEFATGHAYVANYSSDTVSVLALDAATGDMQVQGAPVATGDGPIDVAVHPGGRYVYVVNRLAENVQAYAVDPQSGALTASGAPVAAGDGPVDMVIEPSGRFAYVANIDDGLITRFAIDAVNGSLSAQPNPTPVGIQLQALSMDPAGQFLYAGTLFAGDISAYNISAGDGALTLIGSMPASADVRRMAIDSSGTRLFATSGAGSGSLVSAYRINRNVGGQSGSVSAVGAAIAAGAFPRGIAVRPNSTQVYTANQNADTLTQLAFDATGALAFVAEHSGEDGPLDIAIEGDGRFAYVVSINDDAVTSYDVSAGGALKRDEVLVGNEPIAIALSESLQSVAPTNPVDP
jgi:6-phosphogluconolactonase (cycloisomerase 2 family)